MGMKWNSISEISKALCVPEDRLRKLAGRDLIRSIRIDGRDVFDEENVISALSGGRDKDGKDLEFRVLRSEDRSEYKVVELFAGAGGLALGMENAGLKCQLLVEMDKQACATLRKNRPGWNIVEKDIRSVSFEGIEADILAGGFPCQAFSYAGKRLGFEDIRGTLFYEFARAIKEINPKIVVGENVKGLVQHDGGRTLETIIKIIEDLGYEVKYKILKAHYFDVAQKRERLFVFGVRKDLNLKIEFPEDLGVVTTIRQALNGVPASAGQKYAPWKRSVLELVPEGGYWRDLPLDMQKLYMGGSFALGGGKTGMARRLAWDEPSLTLTCSPAQKQTERCHPSETRPLTIREYARIQSFPDDWEFVGSIASQYKQIGNAVPVNLAYHIGTAIRKILLS